MSMVNTNINKSIQMTSLFLVHNLSKERNCSEAEALKELLKTMTYDLLQDKSTGLYAESQEYVWSMLMDEQNEDWEEWMKI